MSSAAEPVDYFTNHRNKTRFPWSLYHGPIIAALGDAVRRTRGRAMLNLGSGPFLELDALGSLEKELTVCDIDARAVELAKQLHGARLQRADVIVAGAALPYADASFDLVVSMDVIEHVPEPEPWVREAWRVLRPGGLLFLTTPNYASRSLRWLEATVLELIARRQGFSRQLLHPSKMTPARLETLLPSDDCLRADITEIAFGWVLKAVAEKRQ